MNKYVFILNNQGERETSLLIGIHAPDEQSTIALAKKDFPGFTYELGDEDMQQLFYQNMRYLNGQWLEPITVALTEEERQAQEAEQVAKDYEERFKALDNDIIHAAVVDQDEEYANELRASRAELEHEFLSARGEL